MIELNKTYKDGLGRDVRIICVDFNYQQPIIGIVSSDFGDFIACFTAEGRYILEEPSANDLILPEDFRTFAIDEPVMVRDRDVGTWVTGNFAGVDFKGRALVWRCGTKWHSEGETVSWNQCRRPTKEELES